MTISSYDILLDGYPVRMRLGSEDTAATERAVTDVLRLVRPFLDETDIREAVGFQSGDLAVLQFLLGDTDHHIVVAINAAFPDRAYVSDSTRPGRSAFTQPERARFVSSGEALGIVREFAGGSL